jgi:hypothetical protein
LQHRKLHIFIGLILLFIIGCPAFAQPQTWDSGSAASATPAPNTNSSIESTKPDKRLFGVVPNYRTVESSTPFVALTPRQKLTIASKDSFDWPTFPTAAFMTLVMAGKKETDAYGGGFSGFANRYGRNVGDQIIGNMLTEGLMPIAFHQDPRYFRVGSDAPFWSRLRTSLVQIVVSRTDTNHKTFNTSEFVGNAIAVGISNTYSPNLRDWSTSTEKLGLMVGMDMLSNVIKEFGPDVKQHLFHRHQNQKERS